jgi:hypothetical protein
MVVLLTATSAAGIHAQEPNGEYRLKAAYLYNFAKFVEWPGDPKTPLLMCVAGVDPFGPLLEETLRGHLVNGRPVVLLRLDTFQGMERCNVAFISSEEKSKLPQLLAILRGEPVLTVSDAPGFAAAGGSIGFIVDQDKLGFEINAGAAERARLKISSKLLHLASLVIPAQGQGR